jgi:DNA-directed RNA polymerase specialized sigma subunit
VFANRDEVIKVLSEIDYVYNPNSSSLIVLEGFKNENLSQPEPFKRGFLSGFEKRWVLRQCLSKLEARKAKLLMFWYVQTMPKWQIAKAIGVSRSHLYRLRDKALEEVIRNSHQLMKSSHL